jgi:maltooligosyltrehalose trehalohydrolase
MEPQPFGYWETTVSNIGVGTRYQYVLHEKLKRPDPASRFQPEGVHGPSEVMDPSSFVWTDQQWKGLPLQDYIIYELHPGTFTTEGTFDAIIPNLQYLRDNVGITAIELMPITQFPGVRNWGYDGTYLFAPQNTYGGPQALHRLVDACHGAGLAVVLDVVYNHLGPEGNYWGDFGPLFTDHYRTPWGSAINYDGPHSDAVRDLIISNAVYWTRDFHIDALRLDAVHGIFDSSVTHILKNLRDAVHPKQSKLVDWSPSSLKAISMTSNSSHLLQKAVMGSMPSGMMIFIMPSMPSSLGNAKGTTWTLVPSIRSPQPFANISCSLANIHSTAIASMEILPPT